MVHVIRTDMKTFKPLVVAVLAATFLFVNAVTIPHAHALEAASFSIQGGTYTQGTVFPAMVHADSKGNPINVIGLVLRYDTSKLQYIKTDPPDMPLADVFDPIEDGGTITIIRAVTPYGDTATGKLQFATVYFKALVSSGTATVEIVPSAYTGIAYAGKNHWDGNTTGATYTFVVPKAEATPRPVTAAKPKIALAQPKPAVTPSTLGAKKAASTSSAITPDDTQPKPTHAATYNIQMKQASSNLPYVIMAYILAAGVFIGSLLAVRRRHLFGRS